MTRFSLFDNPARSVSIAYRHMTALLSRRLTRLGLGSGRFAYLFILYHEDRLTQRDIAARVVSDKASVARIVTRLEKSGYVRRVPDRADRRAWRVCLTVKARRLRPRLEREAREVVDQLTHGMSAAERSLAAALVKRMAANVSLTPCRPARLPDGKGGDHE